MLKQHVHFRISSFGFPGQNIFDKDYLNQSLRPGDTVVYRNNGAAYDCNYLF